MTKSEYIQYAITKRLLGNRKWLYSLLTHKPKGKYKDSYVEVVGKVFHVNVDDTYVVLEDSDATASPISIEDMISLVPKDMVCITKPITCRVGEAVLMYLLSEQPIGGKFPFVNNSKFSISEYIDVITDWLSDETIQVSEYKQLVNNLQFIEGLSRITTVSATPKVLLAPEDIVKYRKGLIAEMVKKYGEDWHTDVSRTVEVDTKLKAYYSKWFEGDPSDGRLVSGKIKNNAMVKKYLTFSSNTNFGEYSYLEESLLEGYPKDAKSLSILYNSSRHGSYSRGHETQHGGVVGKTNLRIGNGAVIIDTDCKVKYGKLHLITKDNAPTIVNRYRIANGKSHLIKDVEEAKGYIGSIIELRSPTTCKQPDDNYCAVCMGANLKDYPSAVSIILTGISSAMISSAFKATHDSQVSTVVVDMDNVIK